MRIGLAGVGTLGDAHRLDPLGDDRGRDVFEVLEELFEPQLEVEAIPQDEVGLLRPHDVAGRRLVVVDLGVRLGDRFHLGGVAGDVSGDVGNHREGRHHLELFVLSRLGRTCGERQQDRQTKDRAQECHENFRIFG